MCVTPTRPKPTPAADNKSSEYQLPPLLSNRLTTISEHVSYIPFHHLLIDLTDNYQDNEQGTQHHWICGTRLQNGRRTGETTIKHPTKRWTKERKIHTILL